MWNFGFRLKNKRKNYNSFSAENEKYNEKIQKVHIFSYITHNFI